MGLATLERCPMTTLCCGCVSLRIATALIALVGMLGAGALIACYVNANAFREMGAPDPPATILRYSAGIFGVWVFGAHMLLAGAVAVQSEAVCEVWAWSMIVLASLAVSFGTLVAAWSAALRCLAFAAGLSAAVTLVAVLYIYFVIVVANYKMALP